MSATLPCTTLLFVVFYQVKKGPKAKALGKVLFFSVKKYPTFQFNSAKLKSKGLNSQNTPKGCLCE